MDAIEIGMEQLFPQKICHKTNFNCIGTNEENSDKHAILNCRMVKSGNS